MFLAGSILAHELSIFLNIIDYKKLMRALSPLESYSECQNQFLPSSGILAKRRYLFFLQVARQLIHLIIDCTVAHGESQSVMYVIL